MLHKLQRDDFLDDPGLKNDAKNKPIQLPLYQSINFLITEATTPSFRAPATTNPHLPLQYGARHQYGPGQGVLSPDQIPQHGPGQGVLSPDQIPQYGPGQGVLSPDQPSVADLFHQLTVSETEELLFIQLPDIIPGHQPQPPASQPQPPASQSQPQKKMVKKTPSPTASAPLTLKHQTLLVKTFLSCQSSQRAFWVNYRSGSLARCSWCWETSLWTFQRERPSLSYSNWCLCVCLRA
ncbi:DNA-directed RNA polymerase III subunit RPC4 isoform 2-T2 [Salvelinus alpinus]